MGIKAYFYLGAALALVALAVAIWFSGDHHGQAIGQAKLNAKDLADARVLNAAYDRQLQEAAAYETQLSTASDAKKLVDDKFARLAAAGASDIVCHRAPSSHSGPMPGVSSAAAGGAVGPNAPAGVRLPDFEPGPDLQRLFLAYGRRCAEYIDAYNRWPHKESP